jgi:WD40 repeat protein
MVMTMGMLTLVSALVLAQPAIPSLEPYPLPSKVRQALVELAGQSDILILGELHGTQEVPAIAVALLEPLAKQGYRALALEIPSDQQGPLSDWATGKTDAIPSFFAEPSPDGRGNMQVLSLIRIALSPPFGWRLICFDDEPDEATAAEDATTDWIQRDAKMAANLTAERSSLAPDSKVLAICGNSHARTSNAALVQKNSDKQVEDALGKLWPSFAARLRSDRAGRQVRSINIVPHSGGHFGAAASDDGKTSVGVQTIRSNRKIEDAVAQPLDKQRYDWELNLPRATPATFLTPPKNPDATQTAKADVRLVWFPRFSPDGQWLITAHGSWDAKAGGEVRVWETETGKPKFTIPTERGVRTVAWAPHGKFFVSGDYGGNVLFYDAETGEHTGKIQLPRNVEVLQIASDEKRLYAASGDGSVRVYELPSRKELYIWKGLHKGNIWGMALSPDGRKLCAGGKDDVAHVLDVETFGLLHDFRHPGDVNGIVFTDDGKHVLTGCGDAAIRVFDVESGKEVGRLGGISGEASLICASRREASCSPVAAWTARCACGTLPTSQSQN